MIKQLSIIGFRGFGCQQTIKFALPNGVTEGSGLTIITGSNNSGKTTIVESIRAFNGNESPSFSEGRRNQAAGGKVVLKLLDDSGDEVTIASLSGGGSSTQKSPKRTFHNYIIQSRRAVPFEFSKNNWSKESYITNAQKMENQRTPTLTNFETRIFQIEKSKEEFDKIITRILGSDFKWTVEQRDSGSYYIKYSQNGVTHSSEGIGDGIWSVFTICAALFDAEDNSVIVIDEPELSVHPALQKKLMKLLLEYSAKHQIIICTHSPYFISWEAITNGAALIRVVKEGRDSKCYSISCDSRNNFAGILRDLNNPHTLGTEANEVFFLEDKIILVEGQEDVVIFKKIASDLDMSFEGEFFGWGVGGAPKMKAFLMLFQDLGYKRVVAILDGDKAKDAEELKSAFPGYSFFVLPEDDIRDKKERLIAEKAGITDDKGKIKEHYKEAAAHLIASINTCLSAK